MFMTDEEREKQDSIMAEGAARYSVSQRAIAAATATGAPLKDVVWFAYQELEPDARSEFLWGMILDNERGENDLKLAKNWALGVEAARLFRDPNFGQDSLAFKHIVSQLPGGFESVRRHLGEAQHTPEINPSAGPKINPFSGPKLVS